MLGVGVVQQLLQVPEDGLQVGLIVREHRPHHR
jgi:hypothetical protein